MIGTIKSIPVQDVKIGLPIYYARTYGIGVVTTIEDKYSKDGIIMVTIKARRVTVDVRLENLCQLVVEYEDHCSKCGGKQIVHSIMCECRNNPPGLRGWEVKRLPLSQSDWQRAVEEGLVDSGKEVEFIPKFSKSPLQADGTLSEPPEDSGVAVLSPKEKEGKWNDDDMKAAMRYWALHNAGTEIPDTPDEWELEGWLSEYNKNK